MLPMVLFMQEDTQRIEATMVIPQHARPAASVNRRSSQCRLLAVHLLVTAVQTNGVRFSERTKALVVSAHGGLLMLHEPVLSGQIRKMRNVVTSGKHPLHGGRHKSQRHGDSEGGCGICGALSTFLASLVSAFGLEPAKPEAKRMAHLNAQSGSTTAWAATPALRKK